MVWVSHWVTCEFCWQKSEVSRSLWTSGTSLTVLPVSVSVPSSGRCCFWSMAGLGEVEKHDVHHKWPGFFFSKKTRTVGGFLKWWYPTTMGFPTKNDHFGVFWGYHHLRKHLVGGMKLWWLKCMVNFRDFPRETLYSAFLLFILWENKKNYRWCFHIFWFLTGSIHDSGENNDHIGALLQDRDHSTGFFCWGESSKLTPVGIVVSNSSGAHEIHAWLVNLPSP